MSFPILLTHGVCRFDVLWRSHVDNADSTRRDRFHYFRGVRTMLEREGHVVAHSNVPWAAPVVERAAALRRNVVETLASTGAEKLNIVAHSMGGLDARHMLFDDRDSGRIHERVASVSTIGTPHEGSPFADWGLRNFKSLVPLARRLGLELGALDDLATEACRRFNNDSEVVDFERGLTGHVQLRSFAGRQRWRATAAVLKFSHRVVKKAEGENDGLVSVQSARWRDELFTGVWEGTDHLAQLGWWDSHHALALEGPGKLRRRVHGLYRELAAALP